MHALIIRPALLAFALGTLTFTAGAQTASARTLDESIAGTWALDVDRSDEVPAWKRMQLVIELEGDSVSLTRNLGWGRRRFTDAISLKPDGSAQQLPLAWWADNRHLGIYVTDDRMREVVGEVLDEGATLRTETRFTVETQQSEKPMRIVTEYRLHPSGDRLTLIEIRSSRAKPIVHHFTREN